MKTTIYTISELASEFEVTTRTIRYYEDKGLIKPGRDGQKRLYSPADRIRLMLILRGRRLGFSVDESQELIKLYSPNGENRKQLQCYLKKINEKQDNLNSQLKDIKVLQKHLHEAERRCLEEIDKLNK